MDKVISTILLSLILFLFCSAQQKTYGYKYSGKGDILSDCFIIQNGFVLDSVVNVNGRTYRFEYNEQEKLKRDINYRTFPKDSLMNGRHFILFLPGSRDYYYTAGGYVDSVGYGHWDNNVWVNDSSGFKYHYSSDGKIISIIYSAKDFVTRVDENSYDSTGNLILNKIIIYRDTLNNVITLGDTTYDSREYDSLNRVTLRETYSNGNSYNQEYFNQYVYRYDSSGNINCTMASISNGDTVQEWNYYLKFDSTGKAVDEIFSRPVQGDTFDIAFNYDGSGRILKMGTVVWFHYNTDGNLDSLANVHLVLAGYLGGRATLFDSYGNTISLTETLGNYSGGVYNFYYSQKVTGVKTSKVNNRTFTLSQNYPNPFNPTTTISFSIVSESFVSLKIFDILGREVDDLVHEILPFGNYSRQWNANEFASGIYFYRLQAGSYIATKKLLLLK
jgi:hypothetical protein